MAGFLRVSLATWFVGVAGLKLCWTGYFDDFSTLSRPELKNNTAWAVDSLFGLLGLDYAREGAKAPEFSAVFKMLGSCKWILLGFSRAKYQWATQMKGSSSWAEALEETLSNKKLSTKMAERLRGRMVFYECFAAGPHNKLASEEFWKLVQVSEVCRGPH